MDQQKHERTVTGFDVFLAAKKVGNSGKVIGVDVNKDMLDRANRNKENVKADNVSFVESSITNIPLPDTIADCIISNCPGGRVAISDILIKRELSQELKDSMALYVGCIAGASLVIDYEKYLSEAGFCGE
ncbi:hypothetical protein B7463_g6757, partial [Scytalidium lignicola]